MSSESGAPSSNGGEKNPAAQPPAGERFKQGERYTEDLRPAPPRPGKRLQRALAAAGALILVTLGGRALGFDGALSFLLGVAAFIAILAMAKDELALSTALSVAGEPRRGGMRRVLRQVGVDAARVQEDLDKAEAELVNLEAAAAKLARPDLQAEIARMTERCRVVLDEIARDARDADRARKFLVVVIPSARRSVEKFAGMAVRDAALDARFSALVGEIDAAAVRQLETLRADDKIDLEIEMEVLADRLRAET